MKTIIAELKGIHAHLERIIDDKQAQLCHPDIAATSTMIELQQMEDELTRLREKMADIDLCINKLSRYT